MKVAAEVCPSCGGSGWKSTEENRVVRCDCRLRTRAVSLLAAARIPKRYEHCELSNFEFDGPHARLMQARMAACKFVEEYHEKNEEKYIFPEFERAKKMVDLVDILKSQHQAGRAVTAEVLRLSKPDIPAYALC